MIISVKGNNTVLETNKSLNELTFEDFEAAGWTLDGANYMLTKEIEKSLTDSDGKVYTYKEKRNVALDTLTAEVTMKYSEYKSNYSACATKKNTYNAGTKEVTVLVPIA